MTKVNQTSLRQKLPFEDDEFDYVHIQGMAFAIPELKVSLRVNSHAAQFISCGILSRVVDVCVRSEQNVFCPPATPLTILQEINRVLRPGGIVEVIEEGA